MYFDVRLLYVTVRDLQHFIAPIISEIGIAERYFIRPFFGRKTYFSNVRACRRETFCGSLRIGR